MPLLEDAMKAYIRELAREGLADETLKARSYVLHWFLSWVKSSTSQRAAVRVDVLTRDLVTAWVDALVPLRSVRME